ncbi:MAG: restriction endonuclease subunit S [Sulfuricurvum sp.]|nr:restriction endonuclease subunit S [Sulfuricurvum sp.]MDD5386523.1 restriction endonuclease subunit S [Sulfuricurvum sp.]
MNELYELPNGWEWTKLDDFVTIKGGKRIPKGKKLSENKTPYPYIRVTDFNDYGSVDLHSIQYVTEDIFNEIKNYIISDNDLYISIAGTIGKTGIIPEELNGANLTENAAKLVFDNEKHSKYFLLYFTNSLPFLEQIGLATKVVAMPKLALVRLKEVYIPLPSLSEQQQIVSKLDLLFQKIDKSIELHQKNMDEANAFMGSILNEVFGELDGQYKKEKLEKFDRKMSAGGTPLRAKNEYWDNGTIEWFSSGELNQQFTLPAKERITNEGLKNSSAKLFSKGTLLMGMYDTAAMKMSILHTDASCNQAIVGIKPNEDELNIFFLKYQLEYLKPKILEERQGVRQQNLNLSKIKNVEIEFPNIDIQIKVVEYLDSISEKMEKVKTIQKEKMESLKALKASILDKAFRGEL